MSTLAAIGDVHVKDTGHGLFVKPNTEGDDWVDGWMDGWMDQSVNQSKD